MKTKYFFRQLEALDFWCIVDNSCGGQRSRWAGWQSLRGTHPLLWWHGHGSCVRRYTYLFWSGWWNVLRWSWPYRETATRQNHAGNRGTYGILCCRKYKWCVLFWQCCMVLYNHTPIGLLPCTFGHIHLSRSERPFSWQCPAYFMARLLSFNRKRYSRLFQENSHFLDYKGSGLWKSEIHL